MPQEYYDAIAANRRATVFLFAVFLALLILVGFFFGAYMGSEWLGMGATFVIAVVWSLVSWYAGDRIVLGVSGAREVQKSEYPYLFNTIEGLAIAAGVPTPRMYVIDDPSPNAFATGRDPKHASIAVTTGLLKMMNRAELEGVLAHEMSHVKNYDIRTMLVAAVLVGVIAMLGNIFIRMMFYGGRSDSDRRGGNAALMLIGIVFLVISPIIAQLIQLAISRQREYLADASAVELARRPDGLANALRKLAADHTPLLRANGATAHLYIEDPIDKEGKGLFKSINGLFSTHPPIEDRIKKLDEFGQIG
jgi:heat shock protein HtpX